VKLCRDCQWLRWVKYDDTRPEALEACCRHPKTAKTTKTVRSYPSCQLARTLGPCKPEGLLWEEINEPAEDDEANEDE
jgi:hypothetical protein